MAEDVLNAAGQDDTKPEGVGYKAALPRMEALRGDKSGDKGADTKADDATVVTDGDDAGNTEPVGDDKSGEPKDGDDKKPDGGDDKKPEDGKAPEEYEKFDLPEGMEYNEELAREFGGIAKELGLPQEAAQKLVDHYIGLVQKGAAEQSGAFAKTRADWVAAAKKDSEYGGADFEKNLAVAGRALDELGSPELKKYLNDSGLGDNPELIRLCYRAGKLLAEDVPPGSVVGGKGALTEEQLAKDIYAEVN